MAIPISKIRGELLSTLEEALNDTYSDKRTWAVFFTYYYDTMDTKIYEVVPWDYTKHKVRSGLAKVYAVDELGAYVEVMRNMKEQTGD